MYRAGVTYLPLAYTETYIVCFTCISGGSPWTGSPPTWMINQGTLTYIIGSMTTNSGGLADLNASYITIGY